MMLWLMKQMKKIRIIVTKGHELNTWHEKVQTKNGVKPHNVRGPVN
jgi:hypothetical protein